MSTSKPTSPPTDVLGLRAYHMAYAAPNSLYYAPAFALLQPMMQYVQRVVMNEDRGVLEYLDGSDEWLIWLDVTEVDRIRCPFFAAREDVVEVCLVCKDAEEVKVV